MSTDPSTGQPVTHIAQRLDCLLDEISAGGGHIVIPTPCISELLVVAPDFSRAIAIISESRVLKIAEFDVRSAIELALVVREAREKGDKRSGVAAPWAEVKFDRQIASIAKVHGASILYTDDTNQAYFARQIGLQVRHTWDLTLPAKYAQGSFPLEGEA